MNYKLRVTSKRLAASYRSTTLRFLWNWIPASAGTTSSVTDFIMIRFISILISFCILLMILSGCAGIDTGRTIIPVKLQITDNLVLPFKADKCLFDQSTATYYITELGRPNIYLYRNQKQINQIGGLGLDKSSFQKLSDIAIDPDGNLLALDEFARLIRKFSPDGKWVADIDISSFNQPSRFCSTPESDLIIYDNATKELQRISSFDGKTMFTFGRFQVESVSGITASRDMVAVVSENKDKTVLFTGMGLFLKELPSQIVVDRFQNQYCYVDGAVKLLGSDLLIPFGKPDAEVKLCATAQSILLVRDDSITHILPAYQGN